MRNLVSAISGGLFGLGLLISGMTDTAKVQGWLDLFGQWDPTLAFVLGGAVLPMLLAWRIAARRKVSATGDAFPALPEPLIEGRLLTGSALFGAGWALAGFCPGPAIASVTWGGLGGVVFLIAMIGGMVLSTAVGKRRLAAA